MNDIWGILLGAALAIGGGWISDEIRAWRERSREFKALKVAIGDELGEISTTIQKMHEVWTQAKVLSPKYITELLASTSAFDNLRTRLFLIKDEECRKSIVVFYKKIKDTAKEYEGKLGSLANTPEANAEQSKADNEFQSIFTEATNIKAKLTK